MKTLKFRPHLVTEILAGRKTATWRLFDDKNLTLGDPIEFINKETLEPFGTGSITALTTKTLGTVTDDDWEGHDRYPSEDAMYENFRTYYGDQVGPDSEVKIISFSFTAT